MKLEEKGNKIEFFSLLSLSILCDRSGSGAKDEINFWQKLFIFFYFILWKFI